MVTQDRCELCNLPIILGDEQIVAIEKLDENTGEPISRLYWFHEACLERKPH